MHICSTYKICMYSCNISLISLSLNRFAYLYAKWKKATLTESSPKWFEFIQIRSCNKFQCVLQEYPFSRWISINTKLKYSYSSGISFQPSLHVTSSTEISNSIKGLKETVLYRFCTNNYFIKNICKNYLASMFSCLKMLKTFVISEFNISIHRLPRKWGAFLNLRSQPDLLAT